MEQRVLKGSTTTLVSYPRLRPQDLLTAPATSAQVKVWGPGGPVPAFGAAVVDALATTVTADAAAGDAEIAVASATFERGRSYLLRAANGDAVVVESRTGGTSTTLHLAQPLNVDIEAGSAVVGFAVTRALTAIETTYVGQASALWQATVDGVAVEWSQYFRVVSRIPRALLTPTLLTKAYPSLLSMAQPTDVDLEETIAAAWEHQVVPLCEAKGVFDEDIISDESLIPLHALACCKQLFDFDPRIDAAFVDRLGKKWEESIDTTFARISYAERAQDEAPTPREPIVDEGRGRLRLRP